MLRIVSVLIFLSHKEHFSAVDVELRFKTVLLWGIFPRVVSSPAMHCPLFYMQRYFSQLAYTPVSLITDSYGKSGSRWGNFGSLVGFFRGLQLLIKDAVNRMLMIFLK